jgi:hypothetical protein
MSNMNILAASEFKNICAEARLKTGITMEMANHLFGEMMREHERQIEERHKKEEAERRLKELNRKREEERDELMKIRNNLLKMTRENLLDIDKFDDEERARYAANGEVYRIAVRKRKAKAVEEVHITAFNKSNKRPAQ